MSERVESVGELRDTLAEYDDETPVRVNDDGRLMRVNVRENRGVVEL